MLANGDRSAAEWTDPAPTLSGTPEDDYIMQILSNRSFVFSTQNPRRPVAISPEELTIKVMDTAVSSSPKFYPCHVHHFMSYTYGR